MKLFHREKRYFFVEQVTIQLKTLDVRAFPAFRTGLMYLFGVLISLIAQFAFVVIGHVLINSMSLLRPYFVAYRSQGRNPFAGKKKNSV